MILFGKMNLIMSVYLTVRNGVMTLADQDGVIMNSNITQKMILIMQKLKMEI
jgi:hypothetical protein